MAKSFDINKHSRRLYRLCKLIQRAAAAHHHKKLAKCLADELRAEIERRPLWYVHKLEVQKGLA